MAGSGMTKLTYGLLNVKTLSKGMYTCLEASSQIGESTITPSDGV